MFCGIGERIRKQTIDRLWEESEEIGCGETEIQELKNVLEDYCNSCSERYDSLVNVNFTVSNFSLKDWAGSTHFTNQFQMTAVFAQNVYAVFRGLNRSPQEVGKDGFWFLQCWKATGFVI